MVFGLGIAAPSLAQETSSEQSLGEVVVTARRVEERLQDVPISISIVTQQEIQDRDLINSADLGLFTPSLTVNDHFGPEKASFTLRGFNQDLYTQPTVAVYFADVLAPISASATNAGNGVGVGSLFDLENVQVLKGPQGTLFGRNTDGGAILLVPVKPTDKFEGYIEQSFGNYDMERTQAVLNLPINDKIRMRFDIDHMTREGYEINTSGIGPSRFADVNFLAFRWSTVIALTDNIENYTILTYSDSDNHGFSAKLAACNMAPQNAEQGIGTFYACAQLAREQAEGHAGNWDVENNDPYAQSRQTQWAWINTTTWDINDALTVKNIASYAQFREALRESLLGDNFIDPLVPGATKPDFAVDAIGNMPGYDSSAQSTASEELRFTGNAFNNRLVWQAGAYLEVSDPIGYDVQETTVILNCADPFTFQCAGEGSQFLPYFRTHSSTQGLYSQGTYKFTDQLSATGGFRYTWDHSSQYEASTVNSYPTPDVPVATCQNLLGTPTVPAITEGQFAPCGQSYATSSHAPTGEVDIDYKPTGDTLIYAKYARGYRAGGVADLNPYFETWKPEYVDDFEFGTKDSFGGPLRGYIDWDVFYDNFRDQQINANLVSANEALFVGGTAEINAGHSRIWGSELDASVELFTGFRVNVGYAYLNTKLLSLTIPTFPAAAGTLIAAIVPEAVAGQGLTLSPKNRVNVTGTYTLPLPQNIGGVSVSATFTHTDKQIASTASDPALEILPAENLVNLNLNWVSIAEKPFDLSLFVTNVANKYFYTNVLDAWPYFGFESVTPNEPRMFGARLKYHFR